MLSSLLYPGLISTEIKDEILRTLLGLRQSRLVKPDNGNSNGKAKIVTTPMLDVNQVLSFVHPDLLHLDLSPYASALTDDVFQRFFPHIKQEASIAEQKYDYDFDDDDDDDDEDPDNKDVSNNNIIKAQQSHPDSEKGKEEQDEEDDISETYAESTWEDIDDLKIVQAIGGAPNLMHLDVSGCSKVSHSMIQSIFTEFPK